MKVFLGGTYNGEDWRSIIIPKLKGEYFNPVVNDWDEDAQKREEKEKETCEIHLFYINKDMQGIFSIAEAVDSSHRKDKQTLFIVNPTGLSKEQMKSFQATINLLNKKERTLAIFEKNIDNVVYTINKYLSEGQYNTF